MRLLYNLLFFLFTPLFLLYYLLKGRRLGHTKSHILYRLGLTLSLVDLQESESKSPIIWIHAASVGEVRATQALIKELREELPEKRILLSSFTQEGYQLAEKELSSLVDSIIYLPLDYLWAMRRLMQKVRPLLFITIETELWPNMLYEARRVGAYVAMVNGRISSKSYPWYKRFSYFLPSLLNLFHLFCMMGERDERRIIELGAPKERVYMTGNIKEGELKERIDPKAPHRYRRELGIRRDERVFIAGSTHPGEEEMILTAYKRISRDYPSLLLILAPRHVNRSGELERLCREHGLPPMKKTEIDENGERQEERVILLDTLGELFLVYSLGDLVFCGGSFVPRGGQNILEPAAWGKIVFYGPYMKEFGAARELLEKIGSGILVMDREELVERSLEVLKDPETFQALGQAGQEAVLTSSKAAAKSTALLKDLIEK